MNLLSNCFGFNQLDTEPSDDLITACLLDLLNKLLESSILYGKYQERARWDLNPRSPAPKADTLIRARLRAQPNQTSQ